MQIKQRGISQLMLMAIVGPVIVLLVAGVWDISRSALAKFRLKKSLALAAFEAEARWGSTSFQVLPAGHNFCEFTNLSVASCAVPSGASQAFLTADKSSHLADDACYRTIEGLEVEGALKPLLGYSAITATCESGFGIHFGVVKFTTSVVTGVAASTSLIAGAASVTCKAGQGSLNCFDIDDALITTIGERVRANLAGQGGWCVDQEVNTTCANNWLDSFWLVGVGKLKVHSFFQNIFGGDRTVSEVVVRPLGVVAGIQKP